MTTQGMSPYQQEGTDEQPPALPVKSSIIPKIVGVMHLVIGGVTALSGLLAMLRGGSLSEGMREKFAAFEDGDIVMSEEVLDSLSVIDVPSQWIGGADLLTSILMILAGAGLVKYAKWGRGMSNLYVAVSLLTKLANGYVMTVLAKPFYEAFVASNTVLEKIGVGGLQGVVVGSVVLTCIYPFVVLLLVNRKSARESLK